MSRSLMTMTALALCTSAAVAQSGSTHRHESTASPHAAPKRSGGNAPADPSHAVHEAMGHDMSDNPHIRMTPRRVASSADSARAAKLVADARSSLARYKDVRVAEREGYRMFAPNVKQDVYHFTKLGAAIREQFALDVTRPSSLLYRKADDGSMQLVGAMYSAPRNASMDELNERVPLGIARWHLHTNMCVPRLAQTERWKEIDDGKMVFGPASPIATREACDAVDGRFLPVVFNWMVHANVFESDVWGEHH
jgi:hypothetical protein